MPDALPHLPTPDRVLDTGAAACGELVTHIAATMKQLSAAQVLHVVAYDRGALEDVPAWCRMTHNLLLHAEEPPDRAIPLHFYIRKG
jgi:tRNA 2-thiouridine synthesizing protein A